MEDTTPKTITTETRYNGVYLLILHTYGVKSSPLPRLKFNEFRFFHFILADSSTNLKKILAT